MIVECTQGNIDFKIPEEYKKVGIKMSGGVDSSLLSYLLVKYKITERPDLKIIPITGIIRTRPFQYEKAHEVKQKIASLFNKTIENIWEPHEIFHMETATLKLRQSEELTRLYHQRKLDCHVWGVTLNPPPEVESCYTEDRDKTRDRLPNGQLYPIWRHKSFNPLSNIDKQGVAEIYKNQGILEEIFPLTRSCEIDNTYVFTSKTTCKRTNCWWCQERLWGFGTND